MPAASSIGMRRRCFAYKQHGGVRRRYCYSLLLIFIHPKVQSRMSSTTVWQAMLRFSPRLSTFSCVFAFKLMAEGCASSSAHRLSRILSLTGDSFGLCSENRIQRIHLLALGIDICCGQQRHQPAWPFSNLALFTTVCGAQLIRRPDAAQLDHALCCGR